MIDTSTLPTNVLAQHCAEQTHNYLHQRTSDPRFCFELMRRALAEQQSEVLTPLFRIYLPLIRHWAQRHPSFDQTGESADFFANAAMSSFYFALRGGKFASFSTLAQTLSYLKACVHSAIMQYQRSHPLATELLTETHAFNPDLDERLTANELWKRVHEIVTDPDDRLLIHARFALDLKPAQISDMYSERWATARHVSVALQRIRRRLRNDDELRRLVADGPPRTQIAHNWSDPV